MSANSTTDSVHMDTPNNCPDFKLENQDYRKAKIQQTEMEVPITNKGEKHRRYSTSDDESCNFEPIFKYRRTIVPQTDSESAICLHSDFEDSLSQRNGSEFNDTSDIATMQQSLVSYAAETNLNFNMLPRMILLSIFSFLPLSVRLRSAALVCSYWNHLTRDPFLWYEYKLKSACKLDDSILERILSYNGNAKILELIDCYKLTDDGLISAMSCCPSIRKLCLFGGEDFTLKSLSCIGDKWKHLTFIDFTDCYKLKDTAVIKVVQGCSNLSELYLTSCEKLTDECIFAVAEFSKHLKVLDISDIEKVTEASFLSLIEHGCKLQVFLFFGCLMPSEGILLVCQMPTLQAVGVSEDITDDDLKSVAKSCPSLRHFSLYEHADVTCEGFISALPYFQNLISLNLYKGSCSFDDDVLSALGQHCKGLQELYIGESELVSTEGIEAVLKGCLQMTRISVCASVIAEDELQVLRVQHPLVEFVVRDCLVCTTSDDIEYRVVRRKH